MSRLDMAENPVQANIKGVGINLIKINKPKLGRCQPLQKSCVQFTVV